MSKTITNEAIINDFEDNGTLIGTTEPSRETKYSYWEAYAKDGKIIAVVCANGWSVGCGEEIAVDELGMFVDDKEQAINLLKDIEGFDVS